MPRRQIEPLHVAAAVLRDARGLVLLARRHDHLHQGGLWEFPGGKLEPGETVGEGLIRELREELGIEVLRSRPFLCIDHAYPDLTVRLDVQEVLDWRGTPQPLEGQALRWAEPASLDPAEFPAADVPVLTALRLPTHYVISDEPDSEAACLEGLERCLARGERLIQLRAKRASQETLVRMAGTASRRCAEVGARLLVNAAPELVRGSGAHGVHLTSDRLMRLEARPLPATYLVAASCHDAQELAQAQAIGVDIVVLSPLRTTSSHPESPALGWARFASLAAQVNLPVYALGGVAPDDLDAVREAGGFGVAGIGAFWPARPV
jgi:8-oxo-dGTP diphosphatase